MRKFGLMLKYLFFGVLLFILALIVLAVLLWGTLVLMQTGHDILMIPVMCLAGAVTLVICMVIFAILASPLTVIRGSYLVWLNNNVRPDHQLPYNFKTFMVLTTLEYEAKNIMGSNRQ